MGAHGHKHKCSHGKDEYVPDHFLNHALKGIKKFEREFYLHRNPWKQKDYDLNPSGLIPVEVQEIQQFFDKK